MSLKKARVDAVNEIRGSVCASAATLRSIQEVNNLQVHPLCAPYFQSCLWGIELGRMGFIIIWVAPGTLSFLRVSIFFLLIYVMPKKPRKGWI
jgi:hypothetical protein